jgi:hypothetical protein
VNGGDHTDDLCRWEDNIKTDPRKYGGSVRTGFIWLRIGTSSGLFLKTVIQGGEFLDLIRFLLSVVNSLYTDVLRYK